MASLGLRQTVVTVRWQPSDPLALAERPLLDLTVAAARDGRGSASSSRPIRTRPARSRHGLARPEAFGAWLAELARRYPEVRQFVVGNEPNQPAFWRPQFARREAAVRRGRSARSSRLGYDALKDVDPAITVVGVGPLAPRERPSDGQEQRLDLTRPLPRGARGLVSGERAGSAR